MKTNRNIKTLMKASCLHDARKGHVNVKHNGEHQVYKSHGSNVNLYFKGKQISTP